MFLKCERDKQEVRDRRSQKAEVFGTSNFSLPSFSLQALSPVLFFSQAPRDAGEKRRLNAQFR